MRQTDDVKPIVDSNGIGPADKPVPHLAMTDVLLRGQTVTRLTDTHPVYIPDVSRVTNEELKELVKQRDTANDAAMRYMDGLAVLSTTVKSESNTCIMLLDGALNVLDNEHLAEEQKRLILRGDIERVKHAFKSLISDVDKSQKGGV